MLYISLHLKIKLAQGILKRPDSLENYDVIGAPWVLSNGKSEHDNIDSVDFWSSGFPSQSQGDLQVAGLQLLSF